MPLPSLFLCERIAVIAGCAQTARGIAVVLERRGLDVECHERWPGEGPADGVVFLLDPETDGLTLRDALTAMQQVAARGRFFCGVFGGGGDGPALAAMNRTAAREHPERDWRAVEVRGEPEPAEVVELVVRELLAGGRSASIAVSTEGRWQRQDEGQPHGAPEPLPWQEGDVLLVSGGARGVTYACVKAFLEHASVPLRVVLLGTATPQPGEPIADRAAAVRHVLMDNPRLTPAEAQGHAHRLLVGREIAANLESLGQAPGASEVRYERCDVTSQDEVMALVERVTQEWGPIRGVIHGAGRIADRRLAQKTWEEWGPVFAVKVEGWRHLMVACRDQPLRLAAAFSSVSAHWGNAGQIDYSAANEVLGRQLMAAELPAAPDVRRKNILWGPWQGGMVDAGLARVFAEQGVELLDLAVGGEAFAQELDSPEPVVVLAASATPLPEMSSSLRRTSLAVSAATLPDLAHHQVRGRVVVPMVTVGDWFLRLCAEHWAGIGALGFELKALRVLNGLIVDDFASGIIAQLEGRAADEALELAVKGPNGRLHYSALAQPLTALPGPEPFSWKGGRGRKPRYQHDGALFHGPQWQVLRRYTFSGQAGQGRLAPPPGLAVEEAAIRALDGGLQLAVLWTQEQLGGLSLPTGIDGLQLRWPYRVPAFTQLTPREEGPSHMVVDLTFFDDDKKWVGQLTGLRTHLYGERRAAPAEPHVELPS